MRIEGGGFVQEPLYGQRVVREEIDFAEEMIEFRKRKESGEEKEAGPVDREQKPESKAASCSVERAKSKAGMEAETNPEAKEPEKSKTSTQLVVKPDGSRVLMITVIVGGTERVMSLKISEPTDSPNSPSPTGAEERAATDGTVVKTADQTAVNTVDRAAGIGTDISTGQAADFM